MLQHLKFNATSRTEVKLKGEISNLKAKLKQMEQELQRSYTLEQITTVQMESKMDVADEIARADHGDSALYEKHRVNLRAWNVLTEKLQKIALNEEREDVDEKQALDESTLSADELMSQFVDCQGLIQQQERRLNQIDIKDLIDHQQALSVQYGIFILEM